MLQLDNAGWQLQNLYAPGVVASEMGEQASTRIVDVPPRHDEQQSAILGEAREEVVRQPFPNVLPSDLGVGFSATLDRIVDYADV